MTIETLGGLRCAWGGGRDGRGGGDGPVVVLLHGFGAPGDDLVALADWIDAPPGTRFLFPAAPLELGGAFDDARAWWLLDLERMERDQASGVPSDRSDEVPDGLEAARTAMIGVLDALRARGVPDGKIVLGGFSQGAMLALDVALHDDRQLAGLLLLSATLINQADWVPRMAARAGLPVLQTHGRSDGLLGFPAAEKLRDLLRDAGVAVTWMAFFGGHEISPPVLDAVGEVLAATLGSRKH